jgi:hypothetical protein
MNFMSEIALDRRNFLRGASALTALSYSRVKGANDRPQLGLIGCGDRGRYDMGNFQKANCDVVALCDIYAAQIQQAREKAPNARDFKDHRALLEMKELDIVLIATPDHWHAAMRHRRGARGQGRVLREASDAARSKKGRDRESRARNERCSRWACSSGRAALYEGSR